MEPCTAENLRAFEVTDESMAPDLLIGDHIVVDIQQTEIKEGLYFVSLPSGLFVKYVQPLLSCNQVQLLSRTPERYPTIVVNQKEDNFKVIGKVLSLCRRVD